MDKELHESSKSQNIDIYNNVKHYIFLSQEGTTYAPTDDEVPMETNNLQVLDFISAASPEEALLELKRNNPGLMDIGFNNIFCFELNKDYSQNRRDFTLI